MKNLIPLSSLMLLLAVLATWPILVMFMCLQRYFIQGIAITGLKG